ncbi:diguanylate cyclase (GGDEF)-like protein/PAS domain S-box-containing protein [Actinoplanes tereljensis]|uniref:sensor domain-containing diguanylate cyclase n=1 Tax=Paractinoplanes tereljensis TaxID=571912 RepID=UPI001941792A|nr:sensor domain-containing diguanylate cyclase [Actinoplanes tereljensis]
MRSQLDPVLVALVGLGLLLVPWFLLAPGVGTALWVIQTGIDLFTVYLAWRLYRLPGVNRYARRFWAAVVAGMGSSAVADTFQTVLVAGGRSPSDISVVQTCFVILGMVIVVITMLCHPIGGVGGVGRQRLRLWLDAATVLTAVAVFLWYFLLAGQFRDGRTADRLSAAATTAVMMLVTFALIKLLFSANAPFQQLPGVIGALGVTGTAIAAPLAALVMERSDDRIMYLAQLLPCLLIPISLRLQEIFNRRNIDVPVAAREKRFSRVPYAAVAGTQLLLVLALPAVHADLKIWGVAVGVLLSTGLVLARQQAAFQDNERLLAEISRRDEWQNALAQHASDTTIVTDGSQRVLYASPSAVRLLGLKEGDETGLDLGGRLHPEDMAVAAQLLAEMTSTAGTASAEMRMLHTDGSYHWTHLIGTDLLANPNIRGLVWNGRDVTDARRLQDELRHQATHDVLTGLANRFLLQQRVLTADTGRPISFLVIDLDGFKQVNDVHGHHAGDQVLITVADRLTDLVGDSGTVARLGGDEFAVVLPDASPAQAATLAETIGRIVAEPIPVTGAVVTVGASVGASTGTPADTERMLREADDAMYRSKQARRGLVGHHR